MKRLWILPYTLIVLALGAAITPRNAPASITLTTPFSQSGPNITAETDPIAAPMAICADQVTGMMTMTIYPATSQTVTAGKVTAIAPGTIAPVVFTINTNSGAWSSANGQSGWLTGASLTGAQGWLAAALTPTMKDQAEPWLISVGILPGVQTYPW
jgi:hypothetical protein